MIVFGFVYFFFLDRNLLCSSCWSDFCRQGGLELTTQASQSPEGWNYKHVLLCLAKASGFNSLPFNLLLTGIMQF